MVNKRLAALFGLFVFGIGCTESGAPIGATGALSADAVPSAGPNGIHNGTVWDASNEIGAMGAEGGGAGESGVEGTGGTDGESTSVNSDNAARMTQLTAEMQAHTQLFKMVQEATTTTIKTTGEALNGSVRKQ